MTPQRRLVLDLFEQIGSGSHLSAEEVHRQLVDNQSKVSLATIYRTLRSVSYTHLRAHET